MKRILTLVLIIEASLHSIYAVARDTYVRGYQTRTGAYVEPHYRSAPDHNVYNNYGAISVPSPTPVKMEHGIEESYKPENYNSYEQ